MHQGRGLHGQCMDTQMGLCAVADEGPISAAVSLAGFLATALTSCLEQGPQVWSITSPASIAGLASGPGHSYRRGQIPCEQSSHPPALVRMSYSMDL